jgi:hypothetical protein
VTCLLANQRGALGHAWLAGRVPSGAPEYSGLICTRTRSKWRLLGPARLTTGTNWLRESPRYGRQHDSPDHWSSELPSARVLQQELCQSSGLHCDQHRQPTALLGARTNIQHVIQWVTGFSLWEPTALCHKVTLTKVTVFWDDAVYVFV